jgi:hypothetical protein
MPVTALAPDDAGALGADVDAAGGALAGLDPPPVMSPIV